MDSFAALTGRGLPVILAVMAAEISDPATVITLSDRELLEEIHGMLATLQPYLPLLERAAALMDRNPAAMWRKRHGG